MKLRIKIMAMLIALFSITALSTEASAQRRSGHVSTYSNGGPGYDRYNDGPRMHRGHGPNWQRRHPRYAHPRHRYSHSRSHHHRHYRGRDMDRRGSRGSYGHNRQHHGRYGGR